MLPHISRAGLQSPACRVAKLSAPSIGNSGDFRKDQAKGYSDALDRS